MKKFLETFGGGGGGGNAGPGLLVVAEAELEAADLDEREVAIAMSASTPRQDVLASSSEWLKALVASAVQFVQPSAAE